MFALGVLVTHQTNSVISNWPIVINYIVSVAWLLIGGEAARWGNLLRVGPSGSQSGLPIGAFGGDLGTLDPSSLFLLPGCQVMSDFPPPCCPKALEPTNNGLKSLKL